MPINYSGGLFVRKRGQFGGDYRDSLGGEQIAGLMMARDSARSRIAGRLGRLNRIWRDRAPTERDVSEVTQLHLSYMEASRRMFAASGRDVCEHGELVGADRCLPCVIGEDADQTARARARRDVARLSGMSEASVWDAAAVRVARVSPVRTFIAEHFEQSSS